MQVLEKSENKIIKIKFANTAYVLITTMTLVSFIKLIKEEYDRDMHTKTLVHVATKKKICDIEKYFGIMTLEFNPTNESTTTVKMTVPKINEMLNEAPNKKIKVLNNQTPKKHEMLNDQTPKEKEMLNNQAPTKEKEMKKTPQPTTNSQPITHEKSDTEPHIMKLNQSDERQRNNPSLNNPHPSRQIDSESGADHFTKAPNKNDDHKERFTKAPNTKNDDLKKHKKPLITNQKEVENSHPKTHYKDSNRTKKA
jgi:hypothetical protein